MGGGGTRELVGGFEVGGGGGFDGEGAGDAGAGVVDERLVVEGFLARRFVVGDGFEGDVGDLFVFEAAYDVFVGVGEFVVVEGGAHEAVFGEGGGDAGGVAGDPAAAPLLGDECGGARATGGIEDEVTGIGGHENATLKHRRQSLDYVDPRSRETAGLRVCPDVRIRGDRVIF